jgi:L-threonylcarbamoyladenylate synthase
MATNYTTWDEAGGRLLQGEVGVLATDTLYGLVGLALRPEVVERVYALRRRELHKPLIVLIGDMADLGRLQIQLDDRAKEVLETVWPGPVSVVVPLMSTELAYLHRGTQSLAVRLPKKTELRRLLQQTGPLVAPSANLAGKPPAESVDEAWAYFGDEVMYVDDGRVVGAASALIDGRTNPIKVLRPSPGFRL